MDVKIANFYRQMNVGVSQWLGGKDLGRKRRNLSKKKEKCLTWACQ